MDQEKQSEVGQSMRATNWHEFITFLTENIFGGEICDFVRSHRTNLKPPKPDEVPFNIILEDWEWRLFETYDAITDYLREQGPFIPQARMRSLARAGSAINDLFWSEVKLRHPELWRTDNVGIRMEESGMKVLVGFRNSNEMTSLGPFKIMGPFGSEP
jgi:hypothetical protein